MFESMDQSEFGQFVAALWERQGWQTQVKRDDGRVFVAIQRPETGEEGLLWAVADGEVGGKQVQQFQSLCQQHEIREGAIVAAGTVSDHARKVANGTGIELLDSEKIATILKQKGLTDLAKQYAGGESGASEDESEAVGAALDRVKAVGQRAAALASGVPVVAVVVVIALIGAGVLFGPSIPFLGGGGDGISATSTSPEGANASLQVTWNAEMTDRIDPNESDGMAYRAPEGKQFVVVVMSINNTGQEMVPLEQTAFQYRANGTTYRNETLAEHDGFLGFSLGPGQNIPVWTVFTVPEGESGTLFYEQNVTDVTVAVEFERDSSMAVNVSQA